MKLVGCGFGNGRIIGDFKAIYNCCYKNYVLNIQNYTCTSVFKYPFNAYSGTTPIKFIPQGIPSI